MISKAPAGVRGKKLVVLTAFDAPTARWCARGGVDLILVGDSFAMVSLGMKDTTRITTDQMTTAVAAVRQGAGDAARIVADLPLEGLGAAARLIEAGADAVKIECHDRGFRAMEEARAAGIAVMAHVGLLPQEVEKLGGYPLQGATPDEADRILAAAKRAESLGAFACVVEKVPAELGRRITKTLSIPTIGIGAGPDCDGQVLVLYDILGVYDEFRPKFARRYAEFGREAVAAVSRFAADVREGRFPSREESF